MNAKNQQQSPMSTRALVLHLLLIVRLLRYVQRSDKNVLQHASRIVLLHQKMRKMNSLHYHAANVDLEYVDDSYANQKNYSVNSVMIVMCVVKTYNQAAYHHIKHAPASIWDIWLDTHITSRYTWLGLKSKQKTIQRVINRHGQDVFTNLPIWQDQNLFKWCHYIDHTLMKLK